MVKLPSDIRNKLPPDVVSRLEHAAVAVSNEVAAGTQLSADEIKAAAAPITPVNWDQPWWVALYWAHPLSDKAKEGDYPSTEQLRWSAPLPERDMLHSLFPARRDDELPTVEWVNANKDKVEIPMGKIIAFGGTKPED